MEGFLHKWTNYLSGWQPRYFVLDRGILSYYDSQEDVGKASKGSIKMAMAQCVIKALHNFLCSCYQHGTLEVHNSDSCRMDLIIPREQCFYLRAESAAERQRWLVALGSAKACLGDSASQKAKGTLSSRESLGQKLSEMRLFCDVLLQQVVEVQGSLSPGTPPNIEKLNAACSELHGTCSYICTTLDECIKYVSSNRQPLSHSLPLPVLPEDVVGTKLPHARKVKRSLSQPAVPTTPKTAQAPQGDGVTVLWNLEEMAVRSHSTDPHHSSSSNKISNKDRPMPANHAA